jgi:hypothetical protein
VVLLRKSFPQKANLQTAAELNVIENHHILRTKMKTYYLLITIFLMSCAHTSGTDPSKLEDINSKYFDLPEGTENKTYNIKNLFGKVFPTVGALCSGRYYSVKRDAKGVFFKWPEGCSSNGGVWVPDDLENENIESWVINVRPEMLNRTNGVIIDAMIDAETGNFRKSGLKFVSPELKGITIKEL